MRTNVMVVLCAVVLVAGCVSEKTYQREVQQEQQTSQEAAALDAQNKTYQALNQRLQTEIKADQVQIKQLQGRLAVTMVDEILFREGGWEINEKGREALNKIVPVLSDLKGQRIEVQGYTDNVPLSAELRQRFPTNWELSTARATDVVRFLAHSGVNPQLLSASGYGEEHPVASNDTPQGRSKNRRVEIVIVALQQ
jgi:chemotaxis protein MotB